MKYTTLENRLVENIVENIKDATPGVMVRAYQSGKLIVDVSVGQVFPYYDLASLTKVIFTVQSMMQAYDQGLWSLQDTVKSHLQWFPKEETLVKDLLTHSSGLPWWLPVYKELVTDPTQVSNSTSSNKVWEVVQSQIKNAEFSQEQKSVYSDVGFWTLSLLLQKIYQKPLEDIWKQVKQDFYPSTTFEFHKDNKPVFEKNLYAPTEQCPWRERLLQGEVHDQNAWSFGGISTHAGLFGSIDDLGWFSLHLRSQLMGIARYSVKQKTAVLFSKRAVPESVGDWALGYMLPTPGKSSCGVYFGRNSIGHTGFTGTSLWYDQSQDLSISILSNRVLYGSENKKFSQTLRPEIHNWVIDAIRRSGI